MLETDQMTNSDEICQTDIPASANSSVYTGYSRTKSSRNRYAYSAPARRRRVLEWSSGLNQHRQLMASRVIDEPRSSRRRSHVTGAQRQRGCGTYKGPHPNEHQPPVTEAAVTTQLDQQAVGRGYPLTFFVDYPERLSRPRTAFRLILAIPPTRVSSSTAGCPWSRWLLAIPHYLILFLLGLVSLSRS